MLLIRELEAVARGELSRLMVFMPPGSAKSTYVSDLFPAWLFAQRQGLSVIGASNTGDLAQSFSRRVRGRIREYTDTLGYGLDREAEELWTTSNRGQYRAVGVGASIAGFRADAAIVDDPIRSSEEADSETRRTRIWRWFQDDLITRLRPGGSVVLVQTRWHEDDLAGRLLEREAERWKVLSIPAVSEGLGDPLGRAEGEPLWGDDASYPYGADLLRKRETAETRTWTALYQQHPTPDTGDYFRKDWLRTAEPPPRDSLRVFGASDYAVTANGGDYTVHIIVGIDSDDRLYVLDLWRGQTASDQWVEAFCDLVIQWKPLGWAEESGQIKASLGPWLDRRQRERRAFVARQTFPTKGDKASRAQSIRGRMALGGLYVPPSASWRLDFEAELMSFPAGKHDDQVDALGLIGQLLNWMMPPGKPKPAEQTEPTDYRRRPSTAGRSWMTA